MAAPLSGVAQKRAGAAPIVEIVGPAGAGKTTLWENLRHYPELFSHCLPPLVWTSHDAPFFMRNLLAILPVLAQLHCLVTRREAAWMATLDGWPRLLIKRAEKQRSALVLDQGPVFLIAMLREFGSPCLRRAAAEPWWDRIVYRWAATLDQLVWLDAGDEELIFRIRMRPREHEVKDRTALEIAAFLARYRKAYAEVIARIKALNGALEILDINTGVDSPAEVVEKLLTRFTAWSKV